MITISRILCPTDFSDLSRTVLDHAVALARWYEAEVTLMYVAPVAVTAAEVPDVPSPWLSPEVREKLRGDLQAFAESSRDEAVRIRIELAEGGPATEILDEARTNVDLIVLGTHGRARPRVLGARIGHGSGPAALPARSSPWRPGRARHPLRASTRSSALSTSRRPRSRRRTRP